MSLNGDDSTFLSPIWSPKPKHVCTVGIQVSSHVQRVFILSLIIRCTCCNASLKKYLVRILQVHLIVRPIVEACAALGLQRAAIRQGSYVCMDLNEE